MIHEYEGNRAEQGRSRAEQGRSRAEQSRAEKMVHHLKLVPWESWQLWSRVCDGLFSSLPEAALNKASLLTLNYMLPNISACVSVRIQFMHTFSDFLVHCLSPQKSGGRVEIKKLFAYLCRNHCRAYQYSEERSSFLVSAFLHLSFSFLNIFLCKTLLVHYLCITSILTLLKTSSLTIIKIMLLSCFNGCFCKQIASAAWSD